MVQISLVLCASMYFIVCTSNSITHAQTLDTSLRQSNLQSSQSRTNITLYAWSAWGNWSACSRSCGGGVAIQERKCLPRDSGRIKRSRKRRKLLKNPELSRKTRALNPGPDCPGLGRRYHECNTAPCPGRYRDHRSEQCSVYDRRPFRGRFYTWVPYIDGNSPCTLNCRPRGQQFYASLALVEDGTPCTKPGYRAICVHGNCMVVGREGVLAAASSRELRCGRRLVAGLFSRPRLPLGYSYITTVPRGACRLNVTELLSSENYIALKVTNGSYIMNGEFAVSSPGNYEAAGTRFVYTRTAGLDSIFAMGPIHQAIDIMVLYTQPNPNIKYEYLASPEDNENNDVPTSNSVAEHHTAQRHHRHHNSEHSRYLNHKSSEQGASRHSDVSGFESKSQLETNSIESRKFGWKILNFTPCSRSCGGGLQVGKFKCAELSPKGDREVSPAHCEGSPPPSKRRRCGAAPCPPRWRSAAWGPCPVCGPAHRTRIVGCVQDHARGITKISDQKCPLPMPPSSELCDIPNCDGTVATTLSPRLDTRRQVRPKDRIDNFRDGPVISLSYNSSDNEVTPSLSNSYNYNAAGGWLYTEWSDCVGWCTNGVQSRGVRCNDPSGCSPLKLPASSQTCSMKKHCDATWFSSEWSPCSAPCSGRQVRTVICMGTNWRRLKDTFCNLPKPETEIACGGTCAPSWYLSDWGECQGPCEAGFQSRTVWCARGGIEGAVGPARDTECSGLRPAAKKTCVPARCTSRPVSRPTVINPPPSVSDAQQRVTRNQNHNTQSARDRSLSSGACVDKLSTCALAVQARLCHYPYYAEYCCHSCHGR